MKNSCISFVSILVVLGVPFISFAEVTPSNPPSLVKDYNLTNIIEPTTRFPKGDPIPESSNKKVVFHWSPVKKAVQYKLWILPSGGAPIMKTFKSTNDPNLTCGSNNCITTEIELTSREGQWAVRAIDESKTPMESSPWSEVTIFGTVGDKYARCIKGLDNNGRHVVDVGDLPWFRISDHGFLSGEWTVGLAALAQIIKYDFAKKRAGFNSGLGAGISFRFYRDVFVPNIGDVPISRVKSECRAETFRLRSETDLPDAAPVFSITPTVFASQLTDETNLRVEPALMVGFFEDIVNIGAGFNLTGKDGDVGDVFLLFSIGAGFNF